MPWRGRDALGAILVYFGALVVLSTALSVFAPGTGLTPILIAASVGFGVVALAWAAAYGAPRALFGSRFGIGFKAVGIALLGWVAIIGAEMLIGVLASLVLGPESFPESGGLPSEVVEGPRWALILGAVILAPIGEELFFRGFVFQGIRKPMGTGWAVAVSSALFGLFHFSEASVGAMLLILVTTAIGVGLALLFVWTRNLAVPMIAHAVVNGVAVALLLGSPG